MFQGKESQGPKLFQLGHQMQYPIMPSTLSVSKEWLCLSLGQCMYRKDPAMNAIPPLR